MNDLKRMIKGTGIYLVGTIFSRLVQFFLLPIYTTYLTPAEYGRYDLGIAYASFLYTMFYFDIFSGILRFMFDFDEEKEKSKPITSGLIIFTLSSLFYGISLLVLKIFLGNTVPYMGLLYLIGIITVLQQVVGYIARGFNRNRIFVIGGMIGAVVTLLSAVLFIIYLKMDFSGIYISTIMGLVANTIFVSEIIGIRKKIKIKYFDQKLFNEMFRYSLPLGLNSVSYWFMTGFNRIWISSNLSVYDNGLYAVTMKFGSVINLFTQAFQMAWQEITFSKAQQNQKELSDFYSKGINKYNDFLMICTVLALPAIKVIFPFMVNGEFSKAYFLVPLVLLSSVYSSLSSFMASIVGTLKKTQYIFTTTIVGALCNVIIIVIFGKFFGLQVANISLCVGFFASFFRRIQLVSKYVKVKVNWMKFVILLTVYFGASLIFIYQSTLINLLTFVIEIIILIFFYKEMLIKILKQIISKQ